MDDLDTEDMKSLLAGDYVLRFASARGWLKGARAGAWNGKLSDAQWSEAIEFAAKAEQMVRDDKVWAEIQMKGQTYVRPWSDPQIKDLFKDSIEKTSKDGKGLQQFCKRQLEKIPQGDRSFPLVDGGISLIAAELVCAIAFYQRASGDLPKLTGYCRFYERSQFKDKHQYLINPGREKSMLKKLGHFDLARESRGLLREVFSELGIQRDEKGAFERRIQ